MTEQDDTPEIDRLEDAFARKSELAEKLQAALSRLQAVAARYPAFGYIGFKCLGCGEQKDDGHADGCPVGRYEEGK